MTITLEGLGLVQGLAMETHQLKDVFGRKKILIETLKVHMQPCASVRILSSCVRSHEQVYAPRVSKNYVRQFLMENMAELIPHRLGKAPPFSLNTIKRHHDSFPKNTHNLLQKSDSREVFYFEKYPKIKVSQLGLILVQSLLVKLTNPLGILFQRLTEGNGQNQALEAFV